MQQTCTNCGKEHCWLLMGDQFQHICGPCSDLPNVDKHPDHGYYVKFAYCSCGTRGPVNFSENYYWCCKHPDDRLF